MGMEGGIGGRMGGENGMIYIDIEEAEAIKRHPRTALVLGCIWSIYLISSGTFELEFIGTSNVSGDNTLYSHSIVATGFSLMSQSTRFTPGILTMRSRMAHRTENGISGTVAVTASTVLTARMTTAQPI